MYCHLTICPLQIHILMCCTINLSKNACLTPLIKRPLPSHLSKRFLQLRIHAMLHIFFLTRCLKCLNPLTVCTSNLTARWGQQYKFDLSPKYSFPKLETNIAWHCFIRSSLGYTFTFSSLMDVSSEPLTKLSNNLQKMYCHLRQVQALSRGGLWIILFSE